MFYILNVLSFIVYAFLVSKLFVTSLVSSFTTGHSIISILKFIVICFLFYEIWIEWTVYMYPKKTDLLKRRFKRHDVCIFLGVFLGTLFSYHMNHHFALGAVVAASLLGLIGGVLFSDLAAPIYCGAFAGMISDFLVSDFLSLVTIGIFAGLLFVFGSETFKGFGGKLGADAYFATLLSSLFYNKFSHTMTGGTVNFQYAVFIVIILGALGTYYINAYYKTGAVIASSLVGLTFGLILPNVFINGSALASALFCGTFIGMSSISKLSTGISVMFASLIGIIIYIFTAPYFAGLGGKLGLIAFGSSIATAGIYNLRASMTRRQ